MRNLFTYGSLMFLPVWSRLVSQTYSSSPAMLKGYARYLVRDESFPGIVPAGSDQALEGVLYHQVSAEDIRHLDSFEGDLYERLTVEVVLPDQTLVVADTYVIRSDKQDCLSHMSWKAEEFRRRDLQQFIDDYTGFSGD